MATNNQGFNQAITEYLHYCEKVRNMSPTTLRAKQNILKRFATFANIDHLNNLTNEVFNRWVSAELSRGISTQSLNTYNTTILAFTKYFEDAGYLIPLRHALLPKLKVLTPRRIFYTNAEIESVLPHCDPPTRLMVKIMFETGMRIAEITNLRLHNINGTQIKFIGKGQKMREVYLRHETAAELASYITSHHITDYVWGAKGGTNHEPPTIETMRRRLRKSFQAAGFQNFYPHALRHSFATDLQRRGASTAEIKEMLGHASIATTERYLHGFEGKLQELFNKYR